MLIIFHATYYRYSNRLHLPLTPRLESEEVGMLMLKSRPSLTFYAGCDGDSFCSLMFSLPLPLTKRMDYILVLLFLAVLVILFHKQEHMTNKDLLETLSKFGKTENKSKGKTSEEPIYGPKTTKAVEPKPTPAKPDSADGTNVYPDIYGPEITPVPGKKSKKTQPTGIHASDDHDDETYAFNPDFANSFANDENEPQPFLTDFSKFQK